MAMDSHKDHHYELLIDTVNNNHNEKSGHNSASQNGKPECSSRVSSLVAETLSGSSRRKCATLSKGITIEEFLEKADCSNQLTAIDKLILKNKAALAEDQMKRARARTKDKLAVTHKKSDRNNKTKVLSSKVANTKHCKLSNATKTNVSKSKSNSKTKVTVTKVAVDKPKKTAKLIPKQEKVEKVEVRFSHPEPKPEPKYKTEVRHANGNPKSKIEARIVNGDSKNKVSKKPLIVTKSFRNNEKEVTNRKTLLPFIRKLKKEPKINCKSFDMKRLKSNVAYRTRSVNTEKLRNGKTRIIRGPPEERLPMTKKKSSKSRDSNSSANTTPIRHVLKRPIKEEPTEDDIGSARRQKIDVPPLLTTIDSTESIETKTVSEKMDVEEIIPSEPNVKGEATVKEEIKLETDSNIVEINVNLNIVPNGPAPEEYTPTAEAVKSEIPISLSEDASTSPPDLIINESSGIPDTKEKEDSKKLTVDLTTEDVIQDDDASENLNLQLDNLDDDIEEIDVDDQSSHSAEMESIPYEVKEKVSYMEDKSNNQCPINDSARDSIFSALGLKSIEKNGPKQKDTKEETYRGTLKMVIKTDKGSRRMEMKQTNQSVCENTQNENILSFYSKTIQNGNDRDSSNSSPTDSSGSSGMSSLIIEDDADKDEISGINFEFPAIGNVKETTSGDQKITDNDLNATDKNGKTLDKSKGDEPLVVPEKSSSFSIHPNRLCYDVCKYCFGKFGSLDTPCHVGQLKNLERQKTILNSEPNLRIDTCLCDACFRFVDRKANRSSIKRKTIRQGSSMNQRKVLCAVQNCNQIASKLYGKRKWRSKICRKFANLSFDIRRRGSGVPLGLCPQHFFMLDMYTLCGICKKRLNRNDMYSIRTEVNDLNDVLSKDGIPVKLVDNMLLCKYCHHCTSLRLNFGDPSQMTTSNKEYYESFRKEVLRCLRIERKGDEQPKSTESQKTENRDNSIPERLNKVVEEPTNGDCSTNGDHNLPDGDTLTKHEKTAPNQNSQNVDMKDIATLLKPLESEVVSEKNSTHIQLKFGNLNIGKLSNLNIGQNTPPIPVPEKKTERPTSDKELPLIADFSFDNDDPSRGWERCVSTIQFDKSTKKLWQDLQKPYGNQSSFIRHLIMLEKYWRNGALVLSDNAEPGAVKYISSVKNRIESLETFSAPKLPPVPALAPAPSPPVLQKIISHESSLPLRLTPPPLQPAPRPPPPPPPLLKLSCVSSPFIVRKTAPICTVRPSPDFSVKTVRNSLPAPPKLERIPTVYTNFPKPVPVSVPSTKGMVQPQIRPKQHVIQMMNSQNPIRAIPVYKKMPSLTVGNSITAITNSLTNGAITLTKAQPTKVVASHFLANRYARPPTATNMDSNQSPSSMIFAKLPKALTVTQIEEVVPKDKKEMKPPLMTAPFPAPFLVGEKPSVSVFREISK